MLYEICDDIVILYQREVVEQGNAQQVIRNPTQAYTQLLIQSIPIPDPDVRWKENLVISKDKIAHG
jgi:peptide/nickel transport system ATP-binding protein